MLDRSDIQLLIEAKNNGLTIDQTIVEAEKIVNREELKKILQEILMHMWYIAQSFLQKNIIEIEKLPEDQRLDFIVKKSYEKYLFQKQEEEKMMQENFNINPENNEPNNENPGK